MKLFTQTEIDSFERQALESENPVAASLLNEIRARGFVETSAVVVEPTKTQDDERPEEDQN